MKITNNFSRGKYYLYNTYVRTTSTKKFNRCWLETKNIILYFIRPSESDPSVARYVFRVLSSAAWLLLGYPIANLSPSLAIVKNTVIALQYERRRPAILLPCQVVCSSS